MLSRKKFKVGLEWVVAMGWHLALIARGRPAFDRVADDGRLLRSLAAVAVGFGLLRHAGLGDDSVLNTLMHLAIYGLVLAILFVREDRNMTLLAMLFGTSAVVDLAVVLLAAAGMPYPSGIWSLAWFTLEIALIWRVLRSFYSTSTRVQARGYRP